MNRRLASFLSVLGLLACAPAASAQAIWTAAGVTGEVDEADQNIHQFNSTGSVSIKRSVSSGALEIRYPMHSLGPMGLSECVQLRARLRDTGAGARVRVRLMALDIVTGELSSLGEIDSDNTSQPPPADRTEYALYRTCLAVDSSLPFDFVFFAFYVEAQLIKTTSAANPGLMALQICTADRCEGAGR